MKVYIAAALLVTLTWAEPPPSNSYLPPPPSSRGAGYPQSSPSQNLAAAPQVIAARTLDGNHRGVSRDIESHGGVAPHGGIVPQGGVGLQGGKKGHDENDVHSNGFARASHHAHGLGPQARFGAADQGYDYNAAAGGRNALDQEDPEPANYNFGYMVNDYQEGTEFGHREERQDEHAQGEYHVVLPDGRKQTVSYEADERGFKPQISYQETEDLARSGYDSNANDHHDDAYDGGSSHGNGYAGHSINGEGYSGDSNHGNADARSGY